MADKATDPCGMAPHRGLSGNKQAYLKGSQKDTSEMRRRLTERIMAQGQQKKEEWQRTEDTEVNDEQWVLVSRKEKEAGSAEMDSVSEDPGKQLSKKKKETKYSRLSPFQRRIRKQQELNGLLQQLKTEVSKVAEQRYNTC